MERTLARYNKCVESSENSAVEHEVPKKDVQEVEHLKQEIADLQLKNMQILGKDLGTGLGLKELQQLEQLLNEGLLSLKGKKEQLLMEQPDLSRKRNRRSLWKMLLKPSEQSRIFHYDLSVIDLSFPSKAALTAASLSAQTTKVLPQYLHVFQVEIDMQSPILDVPLPECPSSVPHARLQNFQTILLHLFYRASVFSILEQASFFGILRRRIEKLQSFFPSNALSVSGYLECEVVLLHFDLFPVVLHHFNLCMPQH
ncbi:hypothetical protein POM88_043556 [Heracleum sosnowskyi]|uniref:K-box domain-containing protein n=1 Tax=Heracleum sosnowskyi TaxID=360622 RepID=A0AAD8H3R8_9APIA|nr:hypothetical protein POM88_043556 [Heracleum sosnowskyi]